MTAEPTNIEVEYGQGMTFVTFLDEEILDDAQIAELGERLKPVAHRNGNGELVLNFGHVRFMSSAMLGLLVRVHKNVRESNGRLKLCNLDAGLRRVFEITQLNKVFDIS
ncbi:MAG TPA: anti-sigma factor antagonist [Phycisphaerales bacterium]|nr:anti-sigma factor antagonist [Phycisphaerales bacterium]